MQQPQANSDIKSRAARGRVKDAPSGHWVIASCRNGLALCAACRAGTVRSAGSFCSGPAGGPPHLWRVLAKAGDGAWSVLPSFWHLFLFLVGASPCARAGCTYNDLVDQEIDDKVVRPYARARCLPGQVTRKQGQAVCGFAGAGRPCCRRCNSTGFPSGSAFSRF